MRWRPAQAGAANTTDWEWATQYAQEVRPSGLHAGIDDSLRNVLAAHSFFILFPSTGVNAKLVTSRKRTCTTGKTPACGCAVDVGACSSITLRIAVRLPDTHALRLLCSRYWFYRREICNEAGGSLELSDDDDAARGPIQSTLLNAMVPVQRDGGAARTKASAAKYKAQAEPETVDLITDDERDGEADLQRALALSRQDQEKRHRPQRAAAVAAQSLAQQLHELKGALACLHGSTCALCLTRSLRSVVSDAV